MFLCKADIHNPLRYLLMNAREIWHAILVSFADIYPTESLCILHSVPVGQNIFYPCFLCILYGNEKLIICYNDQSLHLRTPDDV